MINFYERLVCYPNSFRETAPQNSVMLLEFNGVAELALTFLGAGVNGKI